MTAGFDIRINIWRYSMIADDSVGGAQVTGTVVYPMVQARVQFDEPDQGFRQQGLETIKTGRCTCRPASMIVYERDEIEIAFPPNHKLLGRHYRIDGIVEPNFNPSDMRGYLIFDISRSDRAHGHQ